MVKNEILKKMTQFYLIFMIRSRLFMNHDTRPPIHDPKPPRPMTKKMSKSDKMT